MSVSTELNPNCCSTLEIFLKHKLKINCAQFIGMCVLMMFMTHVFGFHTTIN